MSEITELYGLPVVFRKGLRGTDVDVAGDLMPAGTGLATPAQQRYLANSALDSLLACGKFILIQLSL